MWFCKRSILPGEQEVGNSKKITSSEEEYIDEMIERNLRSLMRRESRMISISHELLSFKRELEEEGWSIPHVSELIDQLYGKIRAKVKRFTEKQVDIKLIRKKEAFRRAVLQETLTKIPEDSQPYLKKLFDAFQGFERPKTKALFKQDRQKFFIYRSEARDCARINFFSSAVLTTDNFFLHPPAIMRPVYGLLWKLNKYHNYSLQDAYNISFKAAKGLCKGALIKGIVGREIASGKESEKERFRLHESMFTLLSELSIEARSEILEVSHVKSKIPSTYFLFSIFSDPFAEVYLGAIKQSKEVKTIPKDLKKRAKKIRQVLPHIPERIRKMYRKLKKIARKNYVFSCLEEGIPEFIKQTILTNDPDFKQARRIEAALPRIEEEDDVVMQEKFLRGTPSVVGNSFASEVYEKYGSSFLEEIRQNPPSFEEIITPSAYIQKF